MAKRRLTSEELRQRITFRRRSLFFCFVTLILFSILLTRFFYLQVIEYDNFIDKAEANRKTETAHPPRRGVIMDKHGELLAANEPVYTLEITPGKVEGLNKTIDGLSQIIEISKYDRRKFFRLKDELPRLSPVPLKSNLTDEEVARFIAQSWKYPGVEVRSRMHRFYPQGKDAAHVVGYIGRISQRDQTNLEKNGKEADYSGTLYIGKSGLEQSYEEVLHGKPGIEELEVRASGRPIRSLSKRPSTTGSNLVLSLDMGLQREVTKVLDGRRGAIVAIEPATGDVLAFVSNPSFDPNLFVDGIDQETWDGLNLDPDRPLMNRALRGTYPIGSTIKPFLAASAAELGVRNPKTVIQDRGTFQLGNHTFRDSTHGRGYGAVDMKRSIVVSSDVYYYSLAQDMGIDRIHDSLAPFGFGQITGIDLRGEARGILPSKEWKMKRFKRKWLTGDTISVGIGQGYNSFTMLQLAHAVATLANDGIIMKPHLVKKVVDPTSGEEHYIAREPIGKVPVRPEYLNLVKSAMHEVTTKGTGRGTFGGAPYSVAGKTGTAQVLGIKQGEKYDKNKIKERHRDHSLFIAFAPYEKPVIALAILVENGGFGAQAAAPAARKILDYYLLQRQKEKEQEQSKALLTAPQPSKKEDKKETTKGKKVMAANRTDAKTTKATTAKEQGR